MKACIFANFMSEQCLEKTKELVQQLYSHNIEVYRHPDLNLHPSVPSFDENIGQMDIAFVLGGDGTILQSANLVAPYGIPIVGINLGRLGFLTQANRNDIQDVVRKVVRGEYEICERSMLKIARQQGQNKPALNEISITRGEVHSLIQLGVSVNGKLVGNYACDGIIIATPTGSTAYSFSAGGPILSPTVNGIVITPICAHAPNSRPLVVSDADEISIELHGRAEYATVSIDGRAEAQLQNGETLRVSKYPRNAKFITFEGSDFYSILKTKLSLWNKFYD